MSSSLTFQPINRILHSDQLLEVIQNLLINRPIKILRMIPRTGKYKQSCPWVYLENEITGDRMATFLPLKDLLTAFWNWLETAELLFKALWEKIAISKFIWQFVEIGEMVLYKGAWCEVVDKDFTCSKGIPRFWIADSDRIKTVMPWEVQVF